MVDLDGKVVGVDTALYNPEQSGGFIGIGFAIPADTAKFVVEPTARSQPSQARLARLHASGRDARTGGGVGPARREGLDHLRGGRGRTGEHGGAAARRCADPRSTAPSPTTPRAFMRTIVANSGRPAGAADGLARWQGATVTATVDRWPNYMPGGGVMSAQMAEAMIQKMPDPGVQLAPLTDAARKQFGIDAEGDRRTGRLGGGRLRGARPRHRRRRRDHGRARHPCRHARRCTTRRADGAPTAASVSSPYWFRARAALAGCRCRWAAPAHNGRTRLALVPPAGLRIFSQSAVCLLDAGAPTRCFGFRLAGRCVDRPTPPPSASALRVAAFTEPTPPPSDSALRVAAFTEPTPPPSDSALRVAAFTEPTPPPSASARCNPGGQPVVSGEAANADSRKRRAKQRRSERRP